MIFFKENEKTGLSCGINDNGDLFLSIGDGDGYNLPDTQENREYVLRDYDYYNRPYYK